jgi:hypothetical protein
MPSPNGSSEPDSDIRTNQEQVQPKRKIGPANRPNKKAKVDEDQTGLTGLSGLAGLTGSSGLSGLTKSNPIDPRFEENSVQLENDNSSIPKETSILSDLILKETSNLQNDSIHKETVVTSLEDFISEEMNRELTRQEPISLKPCFVDVSKVVLQSNKDQFMSSTSNEGSSNDGSPTKMTSCGQCRQQFGSHRKLLCHSIKNHLTKSSKEGSPIEVSSNEVSSNKASSNEVAYNKNIEDEPPMEVEEVEDFNWKKSDETIQLENEVREKIKNIDQLITVSGQNSSTSDQNSSISGKRNSTPRKRNSTSGRQNSTSGERNSTSDQRNSTFGQNSSTSGKRNSSSRQRSSSSSQNNSAAGKRNSTSDANSSISGQRNSTLGQRNSATSQRNSTTSQRNSTSDINDSTSGQSNSITGQRNSTTDTSNSTSGQRNSTSRSSSKSLFPKCGKCGDIFLDETYLEDHDKSLHQVNEILRKINF